jgi:hypothetical protein
MKRRPYVKRCINLLRVEYSNGDSRHFHPTGPTVRRHANHMTNCP